MSQKDQNIQSYIVYTVGYVQVSEKEGRYEVDILPAYRHALEKLEKFSHAIISWWADKLDTPNDRKTLTTQLPYTPGMQAGMFACRSEYRPNPVAITIMPILGIDQQQSIISFPWLDAFTVRRFSI